jgi:hypothetical protein
MTAAFSASWEMGGVLLARRFELDVPVTVTDPQRRCVHPSWPTTAQRA